MKVISHLSNAKLYDLIEDEPIDDDSKQSISITGDVEGVELAKKKIEAIVASQVTKLNSKIAIDKIYHPFIRQKASELQETFGVKFHIPPLLSQSQDDDIRIVGDSDNVKTAHESLAIYYEHLKLTTRTLIVAVRKRSHRFIIGPKGAHMQEIMLQTGCSVELPPADEPVDQVTVRGPEAQLPKALALVIEKVRCLQFFSIYDPVYKPYESFFAEQLCHHRRRAAQLFTTRM